jgi:hypothetical protein
MATRLSLAEQIQRDYRRAIGAETNLKQVIDRRELFPLINQVANEVLATQLQAARKMGDLSIPSSIIATYSNIPVKTEHGRFYALLPAYPIILPRNVGIFSVIPQTGSGASSADGSPFIPLTQEEWDLLRATDEGLLEDQVGYYVEGRKAFFTKDPTVTLVKFKLLISDPSLIGDNDVYPITPELEATLIDRVLEILKSNTSGQEQVNAQDR